MNDLDRALTRLADAPLPVALDGLDARVLARVGTGASARRAGLGFGVVITAAALAVGVIGAGVPAAARPTASLAPLGGGSPLAPSTLLLGRP